MTENAADSNDTNVEDEHPNFNKPEEIVNALRSVSFFIFLVFISFIIYIYILTPYIHNNMIILYYIYIHYSYIIVLDQHVLEKC